MKQFIVIISVLFICYSCNHKNPDSLRKEIVEIVLKDRIRLNYTMQIIKETGDTISIENLTLIENSYNYIKIDTTKRGVLIFAYNSPPFAHEFYKNSIPYLKSQTEKLKSTNWDISSLNLPIKIDSPLKEMKDSLTDKTDRWISKYQNEKAFLEISEPIYNKNGDALVATRIITYNYAIFKAYILKRKNNHFEKGEQSTLVAKFSEPELKEIIKPNGEKKIEKVRYLICVGYFNV